MEYLMSDKSDVKGVSRRNFLKGFGTGVVGGAVLPAAISADSLQKKIEQQAAHAGKELLKVKVNGKWELALVEPRTTLAEFLRDHLNLTGTKIVCNQGACGSCTVLLAGKAVYSCHIFALDADGLDVSTIEGLLKGEKLHPIQESFIEHDGYQCGFCTPGQIMAAKGLLNKHPKPTVEQVKEGLSGNLCRCAAYPKIVDSVLAAAQKTWK